MRKALVLRWGDGARTNVSLGYLSQIELGQTQHPSKRFTAFPLGLVVKMVRPVSGGGNRFREVPASVRGPIPPRPLRFRVPIDPLLAHPQYHHRFASARDPRKCSVWPIKGRPDILLELSTQQPHPLSLFFAWPLIAPFSLQREGRRLQGKSPPFAPDAAGAGRRQ